jgi:DNA-binding PadR family transcriptional regulator
MTDDILRHLLLGFIRLHVLYHTDKEPICGVELMEELQHHGYDVGPGTIYPMLHQMEADGLLTCKDEILNGKRRKNFRATATGRKLLNQARGKLKELASEVLDDKDARQMRKKA